MTTEEKIAKALDDLWNALDVQRFDDTTKARILYAATPEFTRYYLKGQ